MRGNVIAIVTNKDDAHADAVIRYLNEMGRDVFRLNTEDIGVRYKTSLRMSSDGRWTGSITDEVGRHLRLECLRVAWLRKPSFDFEFGRPLEAEVGRYVRSELRSLLEGIYALPQVLWVNNPFVANLAKTKFQQLALAASLGLEVPKTIITNEPAEASAFFYACTGRVLVKSVYNAGITIDGMSRAIPSAIVDPDRFVAFSDSIAVCPVQLQEYVEKDYELRVTVMRDKVIAVRIDSQRNEQTKVDWRLFTELNPHSAFELPENIQDACREFLRRQQLLFGAMDFIVTPDERYVFLENNPFGQYLWLEEETGLALTREMATLLVDLADSGRGSEVVATGSQVGDRSRRDDSNVAGSTCL